MDNKEKGYEKSQTTFWDFLIAIGSGIVNLLKIEKVICLLFLYLIGRDLYFTLHIENKEFYQENIIDAGELIRLIINSENNDVIYFSIMFVLLCIILILIFVIRRVYVKEIDRLSKERSQLMHDISLGNFTPLEKHYSSEEVM